MITYIEEMWLNSRGGRTESDVLVGEFGKYVLMSSGVKGKDIKVYIPIREEILKKSNKDNLIELVIKYDNNIIIK